MDGALTIVGFHVLWTKRHVNVLQMEAQVRQMNTFIAEREMQRVSVARECGCSAAVAKERKRRASV